MKKNVSEKVMRTIDDFADSKIGDVLIFPNGRSEIVLNCFVGYVETVNIIGANYLQKNLYEQGRVDNRFRPTKTEEYKLTKNYLIK